MSLKALIFDVDGTLAETEETHRQAFNMAFEDAGLDWHWSRELYRELLEVTGGRERIRHYIETHAPSFPEPEDLSEWIAGIHKDKTRHYAEIVASGQVELRPGIERLIREARHAGLRLTIATTTTMSNITALFKATLGDEVMGWFEVIASAQEAPMKKPDPSVFLWVLQQLQLPAGDCLAIEDTANGVKASLAAGVPVLVTESFYSEGEDFSGALAVVNHLGEPDEPFEVISGEPTDSRWVDVDLLRRWHARGSAE